MSFCTWWVQKVIFRVQIWFPLISEVVCFMISFSPYLAPSQEADQLISVFRSCFVVFISLGCLWNASIFHFLLYSVVYLPIFICFFFRQKRLLDFFWEQWNLMWTWSVQLLLQNVCCRFVYHYIHLICMSHEDHNFLCLLPCQWSSIQFSFLCNFIIMTCTENIRSIFFSPIVCV